MPFFALTLLSQFISTRLRGTAILRGVCVSWRDSLDDACHYAFPIFSAHALSLTTPRALNDERLARAPPWLAGAALNIELSDINFGEKDSEARGLSRFLSLASRARLVKFTRCSGQFARALSQSHVRPTTFSILQSQFIDADAIACAASGVFERLREFSASATDAIEAVGVSVPRVVISGFGDAGLLALASGSGGGLRSIVLRDVEALTDAGVASALAVLPRIECLCLSRCVQLSGVNWLSIATRERGTTLRSLRVPCLGGTGSTAARNAILTAFNDPPPFMPSLDALDLSLVWMDEAFAGALGTVIRSSRLRELHLRFCAALSGSVLTTLRHAAGSLAWARLTRLDLAGCGALCDVLLSETIRASCGLLALDVSGIPQLSERSFRALAAAPRLAELHIRVAVRVDGDAVRSWLAAVALSRAQPAGARSTARSSAPLDSPAAASTADDAWESDNNDDEEEDTDATPQPHSTLHAGNVASDRAVLSEMGVPSLPLVVLDAWRALEFDDSAVALIGAAAGKNLQRLDIEGAGVALGDAGVCALVRAARGLRALSLASVPVSDVTLKSLALDPAGLEIVDFSGGIELSRGPLLLCCAPHGAFARLQSIRLSGIAAVDDDVIITLLNGALALQKICLRGAGSEGEGALSRRALDALGAASLRGARGRQRALTHIAASGAVGLTVDLWAAFARTWLRRSDAGLVALAVAEKMHHAQVSTLLMALGEPLEDSSEDLSRARDKKVKGLRRLSTLLCVRLS